MHIYKVVGASVEKTDRSFEEVIKLKGVHHFTDELLFSVSYQA